MLSFKFEFVKGVRKPKRLIVVLASSKMANDDNSGRKRESRQERRGVESGVEEKREEERSEKTDATKAMKK